MAWIENVSIQTLCKIAGFGAVMLAGSGTYLKARMRENLRNTPMYQSAMDILGKHPGAVSLLGEPIRDGIIKIDYRENFCDGQNAFYKVPVSGPKDQAYYYFWAQKINNEFVVTKSELELIKDDTKRLVILKENISEAIEKDTQPKL